MDSASDRYAAISAQFYDNRLLFGDAAEARTVAIEIASRKEVELFKRSRDGALIRERRPLRLFALVASSDLLEGLHAAVADREVFDREQGNAGHRGAHVLSPR